MITVTMVAENAKLFYVFITKLKDHIQALWP